MVKELNDKNFKEIVLEDNGFYLVDFWADWCYPCKMLGPIVEEISEEFSDKIRVGKLHVSDNEITAGQYGIDSIPMLILFKNGEIKGKIGGFREKDILIEIINNLLSKE